MEKAPTLLSEGQRQAALEGYGVLDSLSEAEFDDLTSLAASICSTPIALVTLLDGDRQWFKSKVGITATETPRDISFCGHAIAGTSTLFIVPDALKDERFRDNPMVIGEPYVRFYAGAQLRTPSGFCIGMLCVADHEPRTLSPDQEQSLITLSRIVIRSLGTRRTLAMLRETYIATSNIWMTEEINKNSRR